MFFGRWLRAEEAICMASERIRMIGDFSSAKPPITRRQRETPADETPLDLVFTLQIYFDHESDKNKKL
jgi:hypothetical protein